ncbi:NAD(P)H-dependent oxidoreductase [Halorubellus sp. PRR65]|uniref:NADPH-dependent FMN reductase n=1 Tax=Halorubellus sp. PRR65 TaxID=3098148 RepID=UPI002B2645FC|nr:NAD(P)H-dependent oxidoreductase [Halorubellus sp. PRR65]
MLGTDTPTVVALCGSRRDASKTKVVLRAALSTARDRGADTRLVDLDAYDLPPFDADATDAGDATTLRRHVADADAVLLGTPNYHGSYSGVLKNALDYLGREEFGGKTVGLVEVAGGRFPGSALAHLRTVARTLNAWTLPVEVAVPSSHSTVRADEIVDDGVAERVADLGTDVVDYARLDDHPPCRPASTAGD